MLHPYLETSRFLCREVLDVNAGEALRHEAAGARRNAAAADIGNCPIESNRRGKK